MKLDASMTKRAGWPPAMDLSPAGNLEFDGVDLVELARDRGTPLWAQSRATIEVNFDHILKVFRARYPRCEIAYSVKANNTFAVIRILQDRGAMMDCSAEYEFQLALEAGIPPYQCILNGNGKSDRALRAAAELGVRQVNVDSLDEVVRLNDFATEADTRVNCLVRVQLTYERLLREDPSFEFMLKVGEGKFGANLRSGQAADLVESVIAASNLDLLGLHHHVGFSGYMAEYSPDLELMHHRECARELAEFANEIRTRQGVEM